MRGDTETVRKHVSAMRSAGVDFVGDAAGRPATAGSQTRTAKPNPQPANPRENRASMVNKKCRSGDPEEGSRAAIRRILRI